MEGAKKNQDNFSCHDQVVVDKKIYVAVVGGGNLHGSLENMQ